MGSFGGHAVAGTFFIFGGIWFLINMLRRYFICKNDNSTFISTATFKVKGFPVDPVIKLVFVSVGLVIEGFISRVVFHSTNYWYHGTMYFSFGLTAVIDVMLYYNFKILKDLDYISMCVAIAIEAILFKYHIYDRPLLDLVVHNTLLYILCATLIALIVEMRHKTSILASLLRPFFFILQGTWLFQIGFILYNPFGTSWNSESYRSLMNTALALTWHIVAIFVVMILTFCLFGRIYERKDLLTEKNYAPLMDDNLSDAEI